jgi:hypothetical protein
MMMISVMGLAQNINKDEVWTNMMLKGQDKVEIRIMKPADEVVVLNVYADNYKKVFTKRIAKENNLLISHDISTLPNGEYTYELKNKKQIVSSTQIIKSAKNDLVYKPMDNLAEMNK